MFKNNGLGITILTFMGNGVNEREKFALISFVYKACHISDCSIDHNRQLFVIVFFLQNKVIVFEKYHFSKEGHSSLHSSVRKFCKAISWQNTSQQHHHMLHFIGFIHQTQIGLFYKVIARMYLRVMNYDVTFCQSIRTAFSKLGKGIGIFGHLFMA